MKVQRIRVPESDHISWLVLDEDYRPIPPVLTFLTFLEDLGRSPNTIRAAAHHLKLFWEYLRDAQLSWTEIDLAQLAAFIPWLRQQDPTVVSLEPQQVRRTNATIDQILTAVHGFYDYHQRLNAGPALPLYQFLLTPHRQYKPFLYGIAKTKPVRTRIVSTKREQRRPKTLTRQQIDQLLAACTHTRDQFLLLLLAETGMRVGQVLGLRHADISVEDGEIQIVPREDNPNGARAKTRTAYTIPVLPDVLQVYTDYLVTDLCALEVDCLPDFVFVNLYEGERGRPMTYAAVMSLVKRLSKKTGIAFTPHMLRHSRATTWLRDDALPLPTVSRLLGHASMHTTSDLYLHLTPQDLKRALTKERGDSDAG